MYMLLLQAEVTKREVKKELDVAEHSCFRSIYQWSHGSAPGLQSHKQMTEMHSQLHSCMNAPLAQ